MVKSVLVDAKIEAGAELVRSLDRRGFLVSSAFWYLDSETEGWRLILAMPAVDREGAHAVYRKIQAIAKSLPELSLFDISVVSPSDSLVRRMNQVIQTGPVVSGIRFTGNTIGGILVDDAYIYRLNERAAGAKAR
jgi:hypothetical protein